MIEEGREGNTGEIAVKHLALALALVGSSIQAQEQGPWDKYSGPYKLVITWYQGGITVTDYPNRARCEKGREAVNERLRQQAMRNGLPPESADIAFCIPG